MDCGESTKVRRMLTVDYILFITADVSLAVNRNEVGDERWVSPEELRALMDELDRALLANQLRHLRRGSS